MADATREVQLTVSAPSNWRYLDELGRNYREIVNNGYGVPLGTRTHRQIAIANEIVEQTQPYLKRLAKQMLGHPDAQGASSSRPRIYAQPALTTIDDLVQEGSLVLLERLHTYDPKHSIAGFIAWQFCTLLNSPEFTLAHVPPYNRQKIRHGVNDKNPAIVTARKGALRYALRGEHAQLPTPAQEHALEEWSDCAQQHLEMYRDTSLDDRTWISDAYRIPDVLAALPLKLRRILKRRYGIREGRMCGEEEAHRAIGAAMDLSHETVRKLEVKALKVARNVLREVRPRNAKYAIEL